MPLEKLLFLAVITFCLTGKASGQDRTEIVNRSAQPWSLALVEGTRPGVGDLTLVDKFTGRTLARLERTGESLALPPQSRCLLVFGRRDGHFQRNFILKDSHGFYAEYSAALAFREDPGITIHLLGQHVGKPLNQADEAIVQQKLNDFIEIGSDNIIIHPNSLAPVRQDACAIGTSQ